MGEDTGEAREVPLSRPPRTGKWPSSLGEKAPCGRRRLEQEVRSRRGAIKARGVPTTRRGRIVMHMVVVVFVVAAAVNWDVR